MLSYDSQVHVTGPVRSSWPYTYLHCFFSMSLIWEQKDQLRLQEDKMRELTDALNKQVEENRYNNYDTQLTKSTCQVFKELILEQPLLIPFKLCTHCVLCPDVSSVPLHIPR